MEKRTVIIDAMHMTQGEILVCGWVRTVRYLKDIIFIEINDGSCLSNLQLVLTTSSSLASVVQNVTIGTAIRCYGSITASEGKEQSVELVPITLEILGSSDAEKFPLQKKRHSDEYLRTIAHLRPRTNKYGAMLRIRSHASFAIHSFFQKEGFFYVHTPIITGSDCEGAGEMFRVTTLEPTSVLTNNTAEAREEYFKKDFFCKEAGLTVSGQLEAEALMMGLGKVYTFGPTFRAENSNTARHAAEFWMIEPEFAFGDIYDCMELGERCIQYVVKYILENASEDISLFARFVHSSLLEELQVMLEPFARVSYTEAIDILAKEQQRFQYPVAFGVDLQTEHERFLAEEYYKKPLIVYNYPKDIKAFYMKQNDDGKTVAAMDILIPRIGELVGGSQREENIEKLERRMNELGISTQELWWYLDIRRFGTVPHAGFGIGFERLLMMLTGISNIRDVIAFPRVPASLEF